MGKEGRALAVTRGTRRGKWPCAYPYRSGLVSATPDRTASRAPKSTWVILLTVWEYVPGRVRMSWRSTRAVGAVCTTEFVATLAAPSSVPVDPSASNTGLDAPRLTDGRIVLACNPTHEAAAVSLCSSRHTTAKPGRDGSFWRPRWRVAPGSIIQAADGRLHLVFTHIAGHTSITLS